jgi:hypothetical protein
MSPSGVISGGWEFVTAAYVLSLLVLSSYALSVIWRFRAEARRAERDRRRPEEAP